MAQLWSVNAEGGYMASAKLSKKFRHALAPMCKFRQFADAKDATISGVHKGGTFYWNRASRIQTAGGALTEGVAIPKSKFTITQASLTVTEFGNSIEYSGKLDDLSEQDVSSIITTVLKDDCVQTLDKMVADQFAATLLTVEATSASAIAVKTDGTFATANTFGLRLNHVKATGDLMKTRNIPAFVGDDYIWHARPEALRLVKNDLEAIHQYSESGFQILLNGERFRYENFRFVEQTSVAADVRGQTQICYAFGEDTVVEAIVVPEEIRGKLPGDYGRDKGLAWYYLGNAAIVHNSTGAVDNRIVKFGAPV